MEDGVKGATKQQIITRFTDSIPPTNENRSTADLIQEPHPVLHTALTVTNTEEESEHEEPKEK